MDPTDPRHDPAVAAAGHARQPDGFYSFRAAVLFLCRDHARPRPVSDLCGVQSIAAIAVTRSRHLSWRKERRWAGAVSPAPPAFSPGESMAGESMVSWREERGRPRSAVAREEHT